MKTLNLTPKEKQFLRTFVPGQEIYDKGFGAMDLQEVIDEGCTLTMNQLKGVLSSLQSKEVVTLDECNGLTFIYLGWIFTEDEAGEKIFKEVEKLVA